jgi:transcription termination/antitermination protein NusG
MISIIRTTTGKENMVIESVEAKVKMHNIPVLSLFHPEEIRGYVFIEGEAEAIEDSVKNVPHARGLINKRATSLSDVEKFLVPEKSEVKYEIGDVVEIIGSPFKGEKAKITRIDETKNEITVELLEAAIPIPVTISVNSVRMHEKKR